MAVKSLIALRFSRTFAVGAIILTLAWIAFGFGDKSLLSPGLGDKFGTPLGFLSVAGMFFVCLLSEKR